MTVRSHALAVATALALCTPAAALLAQAGLARYKVTDTLASSVTVAAIGGLYNLGDVSKPFFSLSASARGSAVNDGVTWAKAFINSPAFAQAWAAERDRTRPQPPAAKGTLDEETQREAAAELQEAAEMRKALDTIAPAQRPQMEALIKEKEDRAKDTAKIRQDVVNRRAEDQDRYQADLKKWADDHPPDPKALIASRLQDYLTTCADVDFSAKLETRDGRKIFVDEQYEEKSAFWKMCYRAGREANTAARTAAAAWLKELGR